MAVSCMIVFYTSSKVASLALVLVDFNKTVFCAYIRILLSKLLLQIGSFILPRILPGGNLVQCEFEATEINVGT